MKVIIDDREFNTRNHKNASMILLDVLKNAGKEVEVSRIEIGDIIYGDIAIERKTMADLLGSLKGDYKGHNRFFEQIHQLSSYNHPYLLIEDYYRTIFDYDKRAIYLYLYKKYNPKNHTNLIFTREVYTPPSSIDGLLRIVEENGITIIKASGPKDAAKRILAVFFPTDSSKRTKSRKTIRLSRKVRSKKEWKLFFLSGLPSISTEKSKRILKYFNNDVLLALNNIDQWVNIKGIGKKTVEDLKTLLE